MKELKTEIINAKVTKTERTEIKKFCKQNKLSLSECIRLGINNYKKTIGNDRANARIIPNN